MMEKFKKQDCTKRNLVYETWCETCRREEEKKIDDDEGIADEEKQRKKDDIRVHKYIGETARSVYERGLEHRNALEKMEEDSHLMKHVALHHQDKELEEIKFGIKVVKFTTTAMDRQILESVRIQEESKRHFIMNSKAEFRQISLIKHKI